MNWWKVLANLAAFAVTGASGVVVTATTSTETAVAAGVVGILSAVSTALLHSVKKDGNTQPIQEALDAASKVNKDTLDDSSKDDKSVS